jgi:branched-chain amino acid transport system permease protein
MLTWTEVIAILLALVAVGLLALVAGRGRTGLRLRAERDVPELLPLVGVDPVRVEARMAGVRAAAGTIGGLVLSVTGQVPAPDLGDIGLRAGESLLVGGAGHPAAAFLGGIIVELTRALGDRAREGWGPAAGHALTLVVAVTRLLRGRRSPPAEVDALEEQLA